MSKQDLDSPEYKQDSGKNDSLKKNGGESEPSPDSTLRPWEANPFSPGASGEEPYTPEGPNESAASDEPVLSNGESEEDAFVDDGTKDIPPAAASEEHPAPEESNEPVRAEEPLSLDETNDADIREDIPEGIPSPSMSEEQTGPSRAHEAIPADESNSAGIRGEIPEEAIPPIWSEARQEFVPTDQTVPPVETKNEDAGDVGPDEISPAAVNEEQNTLEQRDAIEAADETAAPETEPNEENMAEVNPAVIPALPSDGAIPLSEDHARPVSPSEREHAEGPVNEEQAGEEAVPDASAGVQAEYEAEQREQLLPWDERLAEEDDFAPAESHEGAQEDISPVLMNEEAPGNEGKESPTPSDETVSNQDGIEDKREASQPTVASESAESTLSGLDEIVTGSGEEVEVREEVVDDLAHIIESIIFASDEPLSVATIKSVLDAAHTFGRVNPDIITSRVSALNAKYEAEGSGFYIVEIANGYQYATRKEMAQWVSNLFKERSKRKLSNSALETVAIIAYKQPITKPEIESIRGVNVDYVLHNLLEKELITVVGRAETVGRPLLYGTTQKFMKVFTLKSLDDLPKLREIEEIIKEIKSKGAEESIQLEITALGDSSSPEPSTEPETKPEVTSENGTE